MDQNVALIGFGEAASTFFLAGDWRTSARAFDIDPQRKEVMKRHGAKACDTPALAVENAHLVLSLVTADQALDAAQSYAPFLPDGAIWCDMNSVAPQTKLAAADAMLGGDKRYVDAALLAPVKPLGLSVPVVLSGDAAPSCKSLLGKAGFKNVRVVGKDVGQASAIKMIRSIMIKGMEALTDEMMAAATAAGVTREVLASLDASEKPMGWSERAAYNLERMATHGLRRAAEMEEAVKTLADLKVEPIMTRSTVARQYGAGSRRHDQLQAGGNG